MGPNEEDAGLGRVLASRGPLHPGRGCAVTGTSGLGQEAFVQHRNLLFSVAYRILGTAADAEDAVQDAWLNWSAADRSQVADPKAYLTRIVSNVALERLRSTHRKRESYVGPWLPEPI